ncbi:TatD family hydrolase [Natronoglycomyces albus]|uniref:TatD family hydrolase n=1 Tax=Natronoglycomyces albus TaxID=2811108 RepID=A0A895XG86_9ACTN|nr:TatD family hydrolase [Natronoglycomyces albus]QSB04881.1 TatD family hydrolase [Natronoglycomyces albus]
MSKAKKPRTITPPPPLPAPIVDSHTHLDLVVPGWPPRHEDIPAPNNPAITGFLDAAESVGVKGAVQVGTGVASSQWAAELAELDSRVVAAAALHPNEAPLSSDLASDLAAIDKLASLSRVVAIGETGMDFYRTEPQGRAQQEESFRAHIEIAKSRDKTLVIHDRDAHEDVLRVLDEMGAPERVVMHCFSGDADFARECGRRGFYMSFAGNVTFKNAAMLRQAVAAAPRELILVETDAPFMAPVPVRGVSNTPQLVAYTAMFLAEQLDIGLAAWCEQLDSNIRGAFGTWV